MNDKLLYIQIFILLFIPLTLKAIELPTSPEPITLGLGQQITFSKGSLNQISIANPIIAHAQMAPDQEQVVITTLKEGNTDLILWEKDGQKKVYPLRILAGNAKQYTLEIKNLLSSIKNIQVNSLGESIIIQGKALRPEDLLKIQQIETLYPNVQNFVQLSDKVKPLLTEEINNQLTQQGFPRIQAKIIGQQIYLTGETINKDLHHQVLSIAKTFYPNVQDMVQIGHLSQPLVRLGLTLMELNRSRIKALGIRWQDTVDTMGDIQIHTQGSRFGITTAPIPSIDMVEKKGWGRILTQPKLICQSGGEAEFHAGGEIPIRLISERVADITYKKYGIILKMSPLVTQENFISLQVNSEISTIDGGNSVEGIPALLTRRLLTSVAINSGETLVLGGLTDQNYLKSIQKVPLLGNIPILGEIFKNRQNRNSNNELLIFIEPMIIKDDRTLQFAEIRNMKKSYREGDQWFRYHLND